MVRSAVRTEPRCKACGGRGYSECPCRFCTDGPGRVFLDLRHPPRPCYGCGGDRGGAEPNLEAA